ncbi:hypothetical protein ACFLU6_08480 [Acidobacteriota bacterium]
MGNPPKGKTPTTRRAITTIKTPPHKIVLAIEVDPTAGARTSAEIALGKAGGGHDPFAAYTPAQEFKGGDLENTGHLYSKELIAKTLEDKVVRVRACKTNLLKSYDKSNGATTFRNSLTTTEELLAEVHVFLEDRCVTGGTDTFDGIRKQMKKTKPGINLILIRLNKTGSSIKDCIIDGVVYCKDGKELAKTGK